MIDFSYTFSYCKTVVTITQRKHDGTCDLAAKMVNACPLLPTFAFPRHSWEEEDHDLGHDFADDDAASY